MFGLFSKKSASSSHQHVQTEDPILSQQTALTPPPLSHQTSESAPSAADIFKDVSFESESLNPLEKASKNLEYIVLEEHGKPMPGSGGIIPIRSWSDSLCYGTGIVYLSGLSLGGAWGFVEGVQSPTGRTFRLRLNSVLNGCTRRGPFVANSVGVLTMSYNLVKAFLDTVRTQSDYINSLSAATLSGMIFKSTRGLRSSLVAGAICAGLAGVWNLSLEYVQSLSDDSSASTKQNTSTEQLD